MEAVDFQMASSSRLLRRTLALSKASKRLSMLRLPLSRVLAGAGWCVLPWRTLSRNGLGADGAFDHAGLQLDYEET
jgi:hypothetical protein